MITENRQYIAINGWAVLAPAAMIAALTIGINVVADAIARGSALRAQDRGSATI